MKLQRDLRSLARRIPGLSRAVRSLRIIRKYLRHSPNLWRRNADIFAEYYRTNRWRGDESGSGRGSSLDETAALRAALPRLIDKLGVKSILDVPCGDFHWMSTVELGDTSYVGVDVVSAVVAENARRYERSGVKFLVGDVTADALPKADLIFCRDLFVHLPYAAIVQAWECPVRC